MKSIVDPGGSLLGTGPLPFCLSTDSPFIQVSSNVPLISEKVGAVVCVGVPPKLLMQRLGALGDTTEVLWGL